MNSLQVALVFGSILVAFVHAIDDGSTCERRCCLDNNISDKNKENMLTNSTLLKNTSSCIEKCLKAQGSDITKIREGILCEPEKKGKSKKEKQIENSTNRCCKNLNSSNDFMDSPKGIQITFHSDIDSGNKKYHYANITWKPVNNTIEKWTNYVILWTSGEPLPCYFGLVPKNQTFFLINSSSSLYKYPEPISFNVFTYPVSSGALKLKEIGRPDYLSDMNGPFTLEPLRAEITPSLMAAIIVGSCVGVAFFVAVFVAWKLNLRVAIAEDIWRRYSSGAGKATKQKLSQTQSEQTIIEEASQVYLSYYHEDDQYTKEIIPLIQALDDSGYTVIMDKMYTIEQLDDGPDRWAQTNIANSSKVIVMCSPNYIKICQHGSAAVLNKEESRVWFEIQIINLIYKKTKSDSKIVCIWMNDGEPRGLPPWMDITYKWPQDHDKIINRLKSRSNRKSLTREFRSSTSDTKRSSSCSDNDDDVFNDRQAGQDIA